MKIAQVFSTPYPPTEGIATYVQGLSRELIRRGHEVVLFTRGKKTNRWLDDDLGADVVEVFCPPLNPFHVHVQEPLFRRYVKRQGFNDFLFHLHTPYPPVPPRQIPYILTVHTPMGPDAKSIQERTPYTLLQRAQSIFLRRRETRILQHARKITSVSQAVANDLEQYGVPPGDISVIGNAVDPDVFRPAAEPTRDYFLYAGRLGPRKGLEDLLEACRLLRDEKMPFRLKVTGRGPLQAHLQEKVRRYDLSAHVEFMGLVPKQALPALYANARAVVIPSHYEGLPTVLLEAMSCEAPVVATDIPGIREVVPPAWIPNLVPAGAPARLADAMRTCHASRDGRARVLANYTWPTLTHALYGTALNAPTSKL